MTGPGKPLNEVQRLAALIDCRLLDSEPEPAFDALTECAARLMETPVALISLIDADRQWSKSVVGLPYGETPREIAFCSHAIMSEEPLVVPDAAADDRFRDNPLVVDEPHVRAYAGAPVVDAHGNALGTLGVVDMRPREWSAEKLETLTSLAQAVSHLIDERRTSARALALADQVASLSKELHQARAWAEEISEVAGVGGWALDLRTKEVVWTEQIRRIHEVDDDYEPDLETAIQFYAPEAVPMVERYVQRAIETGEGWDFELPLITARKRRIWVRSIGRCVYDGGEAVGVQGTFQNITAERHERDALATALKTADKALANLSAYQTALDEHSIVAITDDRGVFKFVNDKYCEISGYDRSELIGCSNTMLNAGRHDRAFFNDIKARLRRGESWHGVACNRAKSGEDFWVDSTVVPLKGDDAGPSEYVAVMFDITDRMRHERALAEQTAKAEAATEAKSRFLANMSHEIRTPLNGVVGVVDALARTDLSDRQARMVELIKTSGETLERLLSDILDFSKIEAGKFDLHTEPFELHSAIESAAEVMRAKAEDKGVSFDLIFGEGAESRLVGDVVRIRQVVANLASNAVKFTEKGGVIVRVDATPWGDRSSVLRIEVEDSGIGFDEETAARLFSRFEQADGSITRSFGGTGLGLSICRALAEMMGGDLSATSEPGVGSRFVFTAPLPHAEEPNESEPPGADDRSAVSGLRVLLAEDHPINQQVVGLLLDSLNISLRAAENGVEAVDAVKEEAFDLILMDMQMPVMDGLVATREIRAFETTTNARPTPIIMLSANAMSEHIALSEAAGCDAHVAKPLTAERLIEGMRVAMTRRAGLKGGESAAAPRLRVV
ncbi:MAG: ATP-binding protein [Pseudomonadota bacterium]